MIMATNGYLNDDDGTPLYVVAESSWGRTSHWLVRAANIKEAKAEHGWTRQRHAGRTVRRARQYDTEIPKHDVSKAAV